MYQSDRIQELIEQLSTALKPPLSPRQDKDNRNRGSISKNTAITQKVEVKAKNQVKQYNPTPISKAMKKTKKNEAPIQSTSKLPDTTILETETAVSTKQNFENDTSNLSANRIDTQDDCQQENKVSVTVSWTEMSQDENSSESDSDSNTNSDENLHDEDDIFQKDSSNPQLPTVVIIHDSVLNGVDPDRLGRSYGLNVKRKKAFVSEQCTWKTSSAPPDVVLVHVGINDIRRTDAETDSSNLASAIIKLREQLSPDSKLVISKATGTSKKELTHEVNLFNALLFTKLHDTENTFFVGHDSLRPLQHLQDEVHPNKRGASLLAVNIGRYLEDLLWEKPKEKTPRRGYQQHRPFYGNRTLHQQHRPFYGNRTLHQQHRPFYGNRTLHQQQRPFYGNRTLHQQHITFYGNRTLHQQQIPFYGNRTLHQQHRPFYGNRTLHQHNRPFYGNRTLHQQHRPFYGNRRLHQQHRPFYGNRTLHQQHRPFYGNRTLHQQHIPFYGNRTLHQQQIPFYGNRTLHQQHIPFYGNRTLHQHNRPFYGNRTLHQQHRPFYGNRRLHQQHRPFYGNRTLHQQHIPFYGYRTLDQYHRPFYGNRTLHQQHRPF
ncbi:hypothetical protein ACOMHN_010583 [Nucella lapillus]